jgi:hypothetical protein
MLIIVGACEVETYASETVRSQRRKIVRAREDLKSRSQGK